MAIVLAEVTRAESEDLRVPQAYFTATSTSTLLSNICF